MPAHCGFFLPETALNDTINSQETKTNLKVSDKANEGKMRLDVGSELRNRILDEAAKLFDEKGIKFTMDDLARSLGMSKKTIYTVFKNKKSIMTNTIDRFFDEALEEEKEILSDSSLTLIQQLRRLIGGVPARYAGHDLTQLYMLRDKYPSVYRHWHKCRENYWEGTEALIKRGIDEGVIKPVSLPILKSMFQHTIEQFFQSDILVKNKISYSDALMEIADILIEGIAVRPETEEAKS